MEYTEMQRVYGQGRYAACREHAANALDRFDGGVVEVRRVDGSDPLLQCGCTKPADFYLLEVNTF